TQDHGPSPLGTGSAGLPAEFCGIPAIAYSLWVLQSLPNQVRAEERNRPTIIVLVVNRPLGAEVVDEEGPKTGQACEREDECGAVQCFSASVFRYVSD